MNPKKKLLLHTCCAPCFTHVFDVLKSDYDVLPYFFNPNIEPLEEYHKRLETFKNYCIAVNANFIEGEYNHSEWLSNISDFRFLGEKSQRCFKCIEFRLNASFVKAAQLNIGIVATTLSISPHKDADLINQIGKELEKKYALTPNSESLPVLDEALTPNSESLPVLSEALTPKSESLPVFGDALTPNSESLPVLSEALTPNSESLPVLSEALTPNNEALTPIKFLVSDFKKNGGFSKSIEFSKQFNLYRQNYCGCSFVK